MPTAEVSVYEKLREEARKDFEAFSKENMVQASLGVTLPNSGKSISSDGWVEGCSEFFRDNSVVLSKRMG